jgi:hypothetical protein
MMSVDFGRPGISPRIVPGAYAKYMRQDTKTCPEIKDVILYYLLN